MTTLRFTAAMASALLLAACGGAESPAEHAAASPRVSGQTESSSGLPDGNPEEGAKLVVAKGSSSQACADCHGKDGNTPNAADVPMLGGQYADYLAHALMAYRDGLREHPLMGPQAKDLSDQQIADASAYFSRQPGKIGDLSHM